MGTSDSGSAWTVWGGTPGIIGKLAYPATDGVNTKTVVTGVADGYTEIVVAHFGTTSHGAWMIFRGSDTSNLWRFGYQVWNPGVGGITLQKVVGGAVTTLANPTSPGGFVPIPTKDGMRLGVLTSGSLIVCYIDGKPIGKFTDTFNQNATNVGWNEADTTARFGPIYCRALVNGV
jgi:hypothetical protein